MCGYDAFAIYDYILDRQCADEMGFETVQDLYEWSSENAKRITATVLGRTGTVDTRNARNTRQQITEAHQRRN